MLMISPLNEPRALLRWARSYSGFMQSLKPFRSGIHSISPEFIFTIVNVHMILIKNWLIKLTGQNILNDSEHSICETKLCPCWSQILFLMKYFIIFSLLMTQSQGYAVKFIIVVPSLIFPYNSGRFGTKIKNFVIKRENRKKSDDIFRKTKHFYQCKQDLTQ